MPWCLVKSFQDRPLGARQVLAGGGGMTFWGNVKREGGGGGRLLSEEGICD